MDTTTVVFLLCKGDKQVLRLDIPAVIGEDDGGLFPFIADMESDLGGVVECDRVKVEMRHRRLAEPEPPEREGDRG